MKTIKMTITAAVLVISSTGFAATKCTQRFTSTGNDLFKKTAATTSNVAQTQNNNNSVKAVR